MTKTIQDEDDIELEDRRVCFSCIGEPFLKQEIIDHGIEGNCLYCNDEGVSFSLGEISDRVETAIDQHFERTTEDNFGNQNGNPVMEVISNLAEIDEDLAENVREVLETRHSDRERDEMGEDGPFDCETYYAEKDIDDSAFNAEWEYFERCLKNQNRYFAQIGVLQKIFDQIANFKTKDKKLVIVEAGPGTDINILYRARVMQSDHALEVALRNPEKEIGPPPPNKTTNGRMSAKGISVFYGALTPETAIEEVRPPMGCRVLVGHFDVIKKIRLLDVETLRSIFIEGSFFDPSYLTRWKHAKFLGRLSHRISMPVMPDDEPMDYLATQAIADYLSGNSTLSLDGIIYPSVMGGQGKRNVVLFQKSARVMAEDTPSEIDVSLGSFDEDGYQNDYWVWEKIEDKANAQDNDDRRYFLEPFSYELSNDNREHFLKLDRSKMYIHHVEKIETKTTPYAVRWHKEEKLKHGKPEF